MKKISLNTVITLIIANIIILMILFGWHKLLSQTPGKTEKKIQSETPALHDFAKKFDNRIYKAFYSIAELRPYAIIQLDKTMQLYENKWSSPDKLVSMLTQKEKDYLLEKIDEFISSSGNEFKYKMQNTVNMWCINDWNFEFLSDFYGFTRDDLLNIFSKIKITNQYLEKFNITELNELGKDELYNIILNYISTFERVETLKFYSDVYSNLSMLAAK
ncbi:MAG: hypothetical protein HW421_3663 [Ignavibacteria bacterium]|nr:hypothetical protein [Ignavibacteria bacterium]